MNTAPLTGVPQRIPVRLVTVDSGGALEEVTEHIGCESANTQVLQVSGSACPYESAQPNKITLLLTAVRLQGNSFSTPDLTGRDRMSISRCPHFPQSWSLE